MTRYPALLALAAFGCAAGGDRTGLVLFPDMARSVPYDAYDRSSVRANGQTLTLPPEGTVAIGTAPFNFGPGPEEAARAAIELRNPLTPSAAESVRGKAEFRNKCQVCHGAGGQGDGPIIGRFPNPPSLLADHAKSLADGQIFHIISRGQGIMASHAAQVLQLDRWRLVLYLRELQAATATAPLPATPSQVDAGVGPAPAGSTP